MAQINRIPSGLLDFLLVQAGGQNPNEISELVRPVIDVTKLYAPDRLRAANEPTSMTAGQLEFIEVPEGEVWLLLFAAITATLVAGDSAAFSARIERIPGQGATGIRIGPFEPAIMNNPFAANGTFHAHFEIGRAHV